MEEAEAAKIISKCEYKTNDMKHTGGGLLIIGGGGGGGGGTKTVASVPATCEAEAPMSSVLSNVN